MPIVPEDGVRRRLTVLDVGDAVSLAAEELDIAAAAHDVGIEEQERLDVAAVARQIVELLLVEAARDGLAVERDVIEGVRRNRDRLVDVANLERYVDERRAGRPQDHARSLEFLEVRRRHLDTVRPRLQVWRLVPAVGVGVERASGVGRLVDDQDRGSRDDLSLRIGDRAANGAKERLPPR